MTSGPGSRRGVEPVHSRTTFAELRTGATRGRNGPLTVAFVAHPEWDRSQVAYAVNRRVGNAVTRNLLRRRLRSIIVERAPDLPVGAYVVRGGEEAPALTFDQLKVAMSQALDQATRRSAARAAR